MTLPPNCLPPENLALSGDLLAGLGQPAGGTTETVSDTPFASLLEDVAPGSNAAQLPGEAVQAVAIPAAGLYSRICYSNVLQPGMAEATDAQAESSAEVEETVQPSDGESTPTEESAMLLAYQLIAGQWVPQPVNTPAEPVLPQEDSGSSDKEVPTGQPLPQIAGVGQSNGLSASQGETTLAKPDTRDTTAKFDSGVTAAANAAARVTGEAKTTLTSDASKPEQSVEQKPEPVSSGVTPETKSVEGAANTAAAISLASTPRATNTPPAKFTAPGSDARAETDSGVNSLTQPTEKKTVVADIKELKSNARQVGTDAANREYSMPYSAANKSSAPSVTALPQAVSTSGMQNGTTTAPAEISAASSVHAPRLVQEIRAIADRISNVDRNTVEVRFDFNESDRLSVRVEYRDGAVHTTFRTNSDSLREVIAREWQAQAVAAEPRSYRVAEPVFSNNNASTSADLSQSGHGSGQSQGQASEQRSAPSFAGHAQHGRSSSGASFGASSAPAVTVRPETSLHLHTFA